VRGVTAKVFIALTSIDAQLIRTLRMLFTRPGFLSVAYIEGRRMPYLAPFKLFLLANAVFFGVQSLTGINVFSSPLDSHLHHQDWSELALSLVADHLQKKHTTLEAYAPLFDRSVILNAKSLVILMVLPFAALLPLFFRKAGKPFMAHVAFGLHLYTFLLFLFCAAIFVAKADSLLGGGGLDSPHVDTIVSLANLVACGVYVYVAAGVTYRAEGLARWLKAALLAISAAAIVIGYRFLLLLITLTFT